MRRIIVLLLSALLILLMIYLLAKDGFLKQEIPTVIPTPLPTQALTLTPIPTFSPVPSVPSGGICKNLCGDGVCQEIVCLAEGCPCPETPQSCPQDCKK